MNITISIQVLIYVTVEVLWLAYALAGDTETKGNFVVLPNERDCRLFCWIVGSIIFTLIYGGIFWW